jgi:zinc transport system ATP-binding protein
VILQNSCAHCCTKIENLGVNFGRRSVLEDIDLHLNCREILALIGPNGAGKTTLLRALLGEIPYSGKINFLVRSAPKKKPAIGYVPQKLIFDLDSPISVLDLIACSIKRCPVWMGVKRGVRKEADEILKKFSADDLMHRRVGELSGGELQRVFLAMAMTPVPDLLLLDEPVSAVDVKGLSLFYDIVEGLKKEYDISIIMATHDLAGVAPHADRMVLLNRRIIADGTPGEVFQNKKIPETFQLSLWNISSLKHD